MPNVNWENSYLEGSEGLGIYHAGPPLREGKLPAVFYFALSGEESLCLDPFNQPIEAVRGFPLRAFSFTLPFHGPGFDKTKAVDYWISELTNGNDVIQSFIEKALENVEYLISQGVVDEKHMAAVGLSRGAFIAAHLAARDSRIGTVLGFAPLTRLFFKESLDPKSLLDEVSLLRLTDKLAGKKLRFYIGNRDERVGTDLCYEFIRKLVNESSLKNFRFPPVELIIFPSIGHKGHGTPPHIFKQGADWLKGVLIGENG